MFHHEKHGEESTGVGGGVGVEVGGGLIVCFSKRTT